MDPLADLRGESASIAAVKETIRRLLPSLTGARRSPPTILIQGETGTGKGLVARLLHRAGPRAGGPFIDVNCAAIPETLLEAELFGYERGAFTDARQAKAGLFQSAHDGVLFLDEIGLLPDALQAKILTIIEERSVRRLGSTRSERVDVVIIAATNEDLAAAVRERRFRADLYHRLAMLTLTLPPIRERSTDVIALAEHFLAQACVDYGMPNRVLSAAARTLLLRHSWPGNVRELANAMERAALLGEDVLTQLQSVEAPVVERRAAEAAPAPPSSPVAADGDERERLLAMLDATGWNVTRAAERLGLSRNTIRYRMARHGLRSSEPGRALRRAPVAPTRVDPLEKGKPPPPALPAGGRRRLTLLRLAFVARGEEGVLLLRGALERAAAKIVGFGGRIEDRARTGLLAVFGHEPVEDAPVRAALAAVAIHNANQRARATDAGVVDAIAAIHLDHFVVRAGARTLDSDAKASVSAFLRSLLDVAVSGATVVSEAAVPFLERRFELAPMAMTSALVGRVYRLVGLESGLRPVARSAVFVGRQNELELLRRWFAATRDGHGHVVDITGESGIGKSRLLLELRPSVTKADGTWLEGRCRTYGRTSPLLPVLDVLRSAAAIDAGDTLEGAREKVCRLLDSVQLHSADQLLYGLLGLEGDAGVRPDAGPDVVKAMTFATLRELLVRVARRRPLVLVIEDLHWVDETSEEFLASLVDALATAPLLLVTSYRPGYRAPWRGRADATHVALAPLALEEGRRAVRTLAGADDLDDTVVETILAKAEGNPFFLEELVRVVQETGSAAASTVPDTVEEVLLARIDRLPPEEMHVLRAGSVIGKDFAAALLEAVADLPDDMVQRSLANLRSAEFLRESAPAPTLHYTFEHALTHEVAYGTVPAEHRRVLHAAIVDAMEQLYKGRLGEHVEELAHHARLGEVWTKAIVYLRGAGERAAARSANREAVIHLDLALEAIEQLAPGRERRELAIDIRFDLRAALLPLGELDRIFERLREAEELLRVLDDPARTARLAMYMTNHFFLRGDSLRALDCAERGLAITQQLDDLALRVESQLRLGQVYQALGDYRRAAGMLRSSVGAVPRDLVHERFGLPVTFVVGARSWLARAHAELGDFADAGASVTEALEIAAQTALPIDSVVAAHAIGMVEIRRGEPAGAIAPVERALELCRVWNIAVWLGPVASVLGIALTETGDVDRGLALLVRAVEHQATMRRAMGHAATLGRLAEAYLAAGRVGDARATALRALATVRAHQEHGDEAWILRSLGDIALSNDRADVEEAITWFRDALSRATELGMKPLVGRAHLGLARALQRCGDLAGARDHQSRAGEVFDVVGMARWRAMAQAELGR